MQEQTPSSSSSSPKQTFNVKSGVHNRPIPYREGMTVADFRREYSEMYRIKADEVAYSGTQALDDSAVITPDMTLEFVKKAGEKGEN